MKDKKITVAKGVKVKRGVEEKMREKKGSSNAGKYKNVSPKEFAGAAGGASKYSFPINDLKHARNALARAHFAPDPEGIKRKVYAKFPELKKHHEEREGKHKKADPKPKHHKKEAHHTKSKVKSKIEKVMHEFKEGKLHSGSKKGPEVTNPRQAIAIALSEARRKKRK